MMKTMGKGIRLLVAVGVLISWSVAGAEQQPVKVGLLAPITGPTPDWGRKQILGMEMALEKINARGGVNGVPVEVVQYDTGGDPARAIDAYRRLAEEDKVLVVIGPLYSDPFKSLAPVTNEEKVAIIATASATPGLSDLKKFPYAFRMTVSSEKKEVALAKAWVAAHDIKTVAVIYDKKANVTRVMAEKMWPTIFQDLGVSILNREDPIAFETGNAAFNEPVQKLKAYKADGICISAFPQETGSIIKEIRRQGLKQPLLGASATAAPKTIEIAGDAAEGLWAVSLFNQDDPSPKVQRYAAEFRKRCRKTYPEMICDPEQYDVAVYDILEFLVDIMKKQGTQNDPGQLQANRDKIRNGLAHMKLWRGTAGMMVFDEKGDGIRTIHIVRVKGGKWQPTY